MLPQKIPDSIKARLLELYEQGLNNTEIAREMGYKSVGHVSNLLINLGFRRQETRRFCDVEANFVIENYQQMGDKELAQLLSEMGYPRTLKMIERFRTHKGLKRTKEQLKAIRKRHEQNGVWNTDCTRTPEAIKKKSEALRKTWWREKWRQVNGLSPITKLTNRKVGNRRYTKKRVLEIRALKKGQFSQYARENGMSVSAVSLIYRQKTYRNIQSDAPIVRVPMSGTQIQYNNQSLNI